MSQSTLNTIPAATVTHTTAIIRGEFECDVTVYHARTTDARMALTFGSTMMTLYSASAARGLLEAFAAARAAMVQVPREIPAPAQPGYAPFARTTLAIEWTRRPAYSVIAQSGPNKTGTATIHWVDLYCGPITFQIRDQLGLHSILELLTRTHRTAVAVFLDGPEHAADPTDHDYQRPQITA
jgi:hypothetical protein